MCLINRIKSSTRSWSSVPTCQMMRRLCRSWIAVERTFVKRRCPWSRFCGLGVVLKRWLGNLRTRWGSVSMACLPRLLHEGASVPLCCLASSLQLLLLLLLLRTLGGCYSLRWITWTNFLKRVVLKPGLLVWYFYDWFGFWFNSVNVRPVRFNWVGTK